MSSRKTETTDRRTQPNAAVEANEAIRQWAQEVAPDDQSRWQFVCECGYADCAERATLTLALYDRLRRDDKPVLAPGHLLARADAVRSWAADVRDESHAVRNQAQQQLQRAARFGRTRIGPYPVMICAECGYGVSVPKPPAACPMCGSTDWTELSQSTH